MSEPIESATDADNNLEPSIRRFEVDATSRDAGLVREFAEFLRENKKWWLIPLVGALLLVGLLSVLATSGAAPFIYTLF
jgi:hypothetical protein